jgi:hypothetical protein
MATKWVFPALLAVVVLSAGTAKAQLSTGLGNYWPFNEGKGTVAHDVVSHHDGTLTNFDFDANDGWRLGGGISPTALPTNYSIRFDGNNDYIDLGNYSIPAAASISAWVNILPTATSSGTMATQPFYILSAETLSYGTTTLVNADGSVEITDRDRYGNTDLLQTAPGIVPADHKWHQITFLRDANSPSASPLPSTLESIYVDGVMRAQGIAHFAFNNPLAPGAIGMGYPMTGLLPPGPTGNPPTPAPSYANGLIDDVRVYNRLLTAANTTLDQPAGGEIAALYTTAPLPGDANLDGSVNISDLSTLLTNYDKTGANWTTGDFAGTGTVDISDLSVVLTNYDTSSSAASIRAVPEPSSLLVAATGLVGLIALVWRRRN